MEEITQEGLNELLKYIKHLEEENKQLKAHLMVVYQQRNSAIRKLKTVPQSVTEDINFEEL